MFSRCYATLSDFLFHHFDVDVPLPIFSFGFFVALGFLVAAYILSQELKRKEGLGLLPPIKTDVLIGEPASY
jgi:phosphatidylglycerol---prolipoprotein diacylglyceryl transferase